ncbi:hypothetical protein ACFFRR_006749 [Megaselia abdita]
MRMILIFSTFFFVNGELLPLLEKVRALRDLGRDFNLINKTAYDEQRYPCDSFFNYVCGEGYYLHSVMATIPKLEDLVVLMNAIERDVPDGFQTLSSKVVNFFLSCGKVKSVDECHRESFEYFRSIYAYIIAQKFSNKINTYDFGKMLDSFLMKASFLRNHPNIKKIGRIRDQIFNLHLHFDRGIIEETFQGLVMFKGNYEHNLKALETNATQREKSREKYNNLVDFTLYLYEGRNMPISYMYSTMTVHLWMSLFNSTDRLKDINTTCFLMPSYLARIEELKIMAYVYYHSFSKALEQYSEYSENEGKQLIADEDAILKEFNTNNEELFSIFYGQNFCQFGKEIADNVFYQGVKHRDRSCKKGSFMFPGIKCDFDF